MPEELSEEIRRFIRERIRSVAQLEILLLLQINPRQIWNADEIARELRIESAGAAEQLAALKAAGLAAESTQEPGRFSYFPASPDIEKVAVALAQAYLIRRVAVIGAIYATPNDPIKLFADAFRLRKDRPPND